MSSDFDLNSLPHNELIEAYQIVYEKLQQLRELHEEDAQRIHELKRNLDTASAAEAYLTHELEQLTTTGNNAPEKTDSRLKHELEELRRKCNNLVVEYDTLQLDYDNAMIENMTLNDKLNELTSKDENQCTAEAAKAKDYQECLNKLHADNLDLLKKFEEFQESSAKQTFAIADKERTIEILRDQVSCLEENLRSKRNELEEKDLMLESAQDQLVEANAKIAMLSSAPDNNDRKGNSLFAEVDDQRQAMKQLLAAQKKSYLQMKKVFNESEHEIRRLKRENIAIHIELQACSTIFCNADKTYQDKLNERIRQLGNENESLERKLEWTQERLKEFASDKSVTWLDSMLLYCKEESDLLKKNLHSIRIQKASLEEQLRNAQQDMTRWRFEALKSRCLLLDREELLQQAKITFKPVHAMEFNINAAQIEAANPRIITATPPLAENNNQQISTAGIDTSQTKCVLVDKTNQNEVIEILNDVPAEECVQESKVEIDTDIPDDDNLAIATPNEQSLLKQPELPQTVIIDLPDNIQQSILTKQRDIFNEDTKKKVQFSTLKPTVHNLSPSPNKMNNNADASAATAYANANGTDDEGKENRPIEPKVDSSSKVVVRRIFIKPKQQNN